MIGSTSYQSPGWDPPEVDDDEIDCIHCDGTGIVDEDDTCPVCNGAGYLTDPPTSDPRGDW